MHENVLLHKFNAKSIPACFSMVDTNKTTAGGNTKTLDKTGNDDTKKGGGKCKDGEGGEENNSGKK